MLSAPHPGGAEAAQGPSGVSDDRATPCSAHSVALHAQPGKVPAASANVPKQPVPQDPDDSPIISGQSPARSLLGAHI